MKSYEVRPVKTEQGPDPEKATATIPSSELINAERNLLLPLEVFTKGSSSLQVSKHVVEQLVGRMSELQDTILENKAYRLRILHHYNPAIYLTYGAFVGLQVALLAALIAYSIKQFIQREDPMLSKVILGVVFMGLSGIVVLITGSGTFSELGEFQQRHSDYERLLKIIQSHEPTYQPSKSFKFAPRRFIVVNGQEKLQQILCSLTMVVINFCAADVMTVVLNLLAVNFLAEFDDIALTNVYNNTCGIKGLLSIQRRVNRRVRHTSSTLQDNAPLPLLPDVALETYCGLWDLEPFSTSSQRSEEENNRKVSNKTMETNWPLRFHLPENKSILRRSFTAGFGGMLVILIIFIGVFSTLICGDCVYSQWYW